MYLPLKYRISTDSVISIALGEPFDRGRVVMGGVVKGSLC
jgi:hypothetical protein